MNRLKTNQIQQVKEMFLEKQQYICPLCTISLREMPSVNICLDHDHHTGMVRGVLCRNCNSMEGKISRAITRAKRTLSVVEYLRRLQEYWAFNQSGSIIHPTFKTPEEKLLLRNKRARLARAKRKCRTKRYLKNN